MEIEVVTVPYRYDEREQGLGAGPGELVRAGLFDILRQANHEPIGPTEAYLDPAEREPGRTAVNIGKLGAQTAHLVARAKGAGRAVLLLAGDDTAAVGMVAGLQRALGTGKSIGVVWLDAHGDFNTPETTVSGILAGMPLAILAGLAGPHWRGAAGLGAPIPTDQMVIAGVRDLDVSEEQLLRATSARIVTTKELRTPGVFADALKRVLTHCDALCVHVDLDVLDPRLVPSATTPAPYGLEISEVAAVIRMALETGKVAALGLAGLNPGAGARGQRSIASTRALIEESIGAWTSAPT